MESKKGTVSCKDAALASSESSLTWCLSQLHKEVAPDNNVGKSIEKTESATRKVRPSLWRALVALRTGHIKGGKAISCYRAHGGLPPLLKIIQQRAHDRKTLDLALSILANCCTESQTRVEVRKLGGIPIVVEVLKSTAVVTVQNRAARALGNLAVDPENSALIHKAGGVPPLLICLALPPCNSSSPALQQTLPTPEVERAQSAARTIVYLGDTQSNRLSLLSHGALPALALLISPEYPHGLRRASLRALNELTKSCGMECAREVSRSGLLPQLGALISEEDSQPHAEIALRVLANMCSQGCLRPLLGSLGVIGKFVEEVKNDPLKSGLFFRALCLCCKEAVNRAKVKESGGLEVLIGTLARSQSQVLARSAILAFVDFVYDESALEHLQGLGLVPLLIARLVDLAKGDDVTDEVEGSSVHSSANMAMSCFDSFDFPTPEMSRKEDGGKEQGHESSSFLSLRSWLLSEGLISCEGELPPPPGSAEGELPTIYSQAPQITALSDKLSPVTSMSSSQTSSSFSLPSSSHKVANLSSTPSTSTPKPHLTPPSPSTTHLYPSKAFSPSEKTSDSLTVVPSPETPSSPLKLPVYHHPYHPEPWGPESPILLLLSRFSQSVDPSSALVNSASISGLLCYLTQHKEPSSRCFRLLCRLSCNPNCLEGLIKTGSIVMIWYYLCLQAGKDSRRKQTNKVRSRVRQLGKAVLRNLRVQSESGFGSGVLTHLMLSGTETDKLYCTLSLPLINSNKVLLKKLLLENGGLQLVFEAFDCHNNDNDYVAGWWRSLSSWLLPSHSASTSCHRALYFSLLTECLSNVVGHTEVEAIKGAELALKLSTNFQVKMQTNQTPPPRKQNVDYFCPYHDASFDVVFVLDDSTRIPANIEAVAGDDNGQTRSEYFRALLRGGFGEAKGNSVEGILIKDVTSQMAFPVLHYLHGCSLNLEGHEERYKMEMNMPEHKESRNSRCPVLGSLTEMSLRDIVPITGVGFEENCAFQKTSLAEAMKGASRFLVAGLQNELECLCSSLLVSLAVSISKSKSLPLTESEGQLKRNGVNKKDMVGGTSVELMSGRDSANLKSCTLVSEQDSNTGTVCCRGPKRKRDSKIAFNSVLKAKDGQHNIRVPEFQLLGSWLGQARLSSDLLSQGKAKNMLHAIPSLTPQRMQCRKMCSDSQMECTIFEHILGIPIDIDPVVKVSQQDMSSSSLELRPKTEKCKLRLKSGVRFKCRSFPEEYSNLANSRINSKVHCLANLETPCMPEPKSAMEEKADQNTKVSPECDWDDQTWSLLNCLPELYNFSQYYNYPKLSRTCLSVLFKLHGSCVHFPASPPADCLHQLVNQAHCMESLKRDLLALVSQALN